MQAQQPQVRLSGDAQAFVVPREGLEALLSYLAGRPWIEANPLIAVLDQARPLTIPALEKPDEAPANTGHPSPFSADEVAAQ